MLAELFSMSEVGMCLAFKKGHWEGVMIFVVFSMCFFIHGFIFSQSKPNYEYRTIV